MMRNEKCPDLKKNVVFGSERDVGNGITNGEGGP
jgi:hypothetical protein